MRARTLLGKVKDKCLRTSVLILRLPQVCNYQALDIPPLLITSLSLHPRSKGLQILPEIPVTLGHKREGKKSKHAFAF